MTEPTTIATPELHRAPVAPVWHRLLGIVGGLGPLAHIEMERRLIRAAARRFQDMGEPVIDQLYPPWVVASVPQTPDRTAAIRDRGPSPVPMVLGALRMLRKCACDFALIPCNTSHAWIRELKAANELPVLDMVHATVEAATRLSGRSARIGVLATDGALASGIYSSDNATFNREGVRFVSPLDLREGRCAQSVVMDCIYGPLQTETGVRVGGIKGGVHVDNPDARRAIEAALCRVVSQLTDQGASSVILGCTELPIILDRDTVRRHLNRDIHLIDPMEVAADIAIRIAAGDEALPR